MARIYLAGPMRGYEDHNFPLFKKVTQMLRGQGYEVLSPIEIGEKHFGPIASAPYHKYLEKDILELLTCDTICLLPGWHHSSDACVEASIAKVLNYDFMRYEASNNTIYKNIDTPEVIEVTGSYGPRNG